MNQPRVGDRFSFNGLTFMVTRPKKGFTVECAVVLEDGSLGRIQQTSWQHAHGHTWDHGMDDDGRNAKGGKVKRAA